MRAISLYLAITFVWSAGCGGVLKENNEDKADESVVPTLKAYPNPFSSLSHPNNKLFYFTLEEADSVKIEMYDIDGKSKGVILNSFLYAGNHQVELDTHDLESGVYFVRITTSVGSDVKRIMVLK